MLTPYFFAYLGSFILTNVISKASVSSSMLSNPSKTFLQLGQTFESKLIGNHRLMLELINEARVMKNLINSLLKTKNLQKYTATKSSSFKSLSSMCLLTSSISSPAEKTSSEVSQERTFWESVKSLPEIQAKNILNRKLVYYIIQG